MNINEKSYEVIIIKFISYLLIMLIDNIILIHLSHVVPAHHAHR
jgi:hypothetical protein